MRPPSDASSPVDPAAAPPEDAARFRRTLVRVMSMQLFALAVLWLLQARYSR